MSKARFENEDLLDNDSEAANLKKKAAAKRARQNRKERDETMKSLGLTKVRGAVSGKIYWE